MTEMPAFVAKKKRRKSVTRLAVVQALYFMEFSGASLEETLHDFLYYRLTEIIPQEDGQPEQILLSPDPEFLQQLLFGITFQKEMLDQTLMSYLDGQWREDRLEFLLQCLLRAGIFELLHFEETPSKVIITEYVDLAYAFYAGNEPKIVNALLDRVARDVREDMKSAG